MFGLALSGGGLLGAAHLGVVQALGEHGLVPSGYAGTSAGGLVAGLLAAGVPVADIIAAGQAVANDPARFFDVNWRGLLHELPFEEGPPPTGLIQPDRFLQHLLALCPQVTSTSAWKAPCALVSLDVVAEEAVAFVHPATTPGPARGRWRIAADRPLAEALRATMALPGLFEGVRTPHSVLVDGGGADTLPADWAAALVGGPVLAVDVAPPRHLPPAHIGLWDVIALSEAYATATESELRAAGLPVLVVAPETADIPFFGFRDYGRLIARGRQAVERALPAIERFLGNHDAGA
jgi:NTE family protein